jgi:hypothetical protein
MRDALRVHKDDEPVVIHAAPGAPFAPTLVYRWRHGLAEVYAGRLSVLHLQSS